VVDVVPLDICSVILGNPYMWDRDGIYYRRLNKLRLVKDGKMFLASAHKSRKKLPLVTTGQVKHLVNASKMFILIMVKIGASSEVNLTLSAMCNTDLRPLVMCKREK